MLKNKVIGTFVAIWFAVCLSYGGLRAAFTTVLGESVASAQELTTAWSDDEDAASQTVVVFDREETEEVTEASLEESQDEPTEALVEKPEDDAAEAPEAEQAQEPATEEVLEEESSWYEEEESWKEEESWEAEAEEIYVPSLEEYLSQYTCGSCRRNCSLANPRCFNGSQLADAKAQEYYSLFY